MLVIGVVVSLLLGTFLFKTRCLKNQLAVYSAQETALNEKIEEEQKRTEEIDELKEYMRTDDYAEEVARERLGLVKDNEIVFQEKEETGN